MYPALRPGDTLVLAQVRPHDIAPGDIVCIPLKSDYTAHRIVDVVRGAGLPAIITKGDNLPYPDPPVTLPKGGILKVVMISRAERGHGRPRFGRLLAVLSRNNLTVGIIKGRIGRSLRGAYGRLSTFFQWGVPLP